MIGFGNDLNIMGNIFGINRIVDAKNKKIISLNNETQNLGNHECFDFWKGKSECINCISMRALNENKSFSKIETVNDRVYFIMASPLNINNDRYVLELVNDITEDDIRNFLSVNINSKMKEEILSLNKQLVTDELTNTFNRRYINEKLPYSLNKFINNEIKLSIMMLDIDKFKSINDTYGHDCGDYVLKAVSKELLDFTSNNNGWVARYGGDEFIIVFENLSKDDSYTIASKIKEAVEYNIIYYNGKEISVTCSIGISFPRVEDIDINSLIKEADVKLYEAKQAFYSMSGA